MTWRNDPALYRARYVPIATGSSVPLLLSQRQRQRRRPRSFRLESSQRLLRRNYPRLLIVVATLSLLTLLVIARTTLSSSSSKSPSANVSRILTRYHEIESSSPPRYQLIRISPPSKRQQPQPLLPLLENSVINDTTVKSPDEHQHSTNTTLSSSSSSSSRLLISPGNPRTRENRSLPFSLIRDGWPPRTIKNRQGLAILLLLAGCLLWIQKGRHFHLLWDRGDDGNEDDASLCSDETEEEDELYRVLYCSDPSVMGYGSFASPSSPLVRVETRRRAQSFSSTWTGDYFDKFDV